MLKIVTHSSLLLLHFVRVWILAFVAILVFFTEALVEVIVLAVVGAPGRSVGIRVSPVGGRLACVHLWKQKTKNRFAVFPVEIVKLDCDLGLLHLLVLEVLFCKFGSGIYQRQKLRLRHTVLQISLSFFFAAFLLFYLLHALQEELLDVWTLIKNHLTKCSQVSELWIL